MRIPIITLGLRLARNNYGDARALIRDRVFGLTRSIVFEAPCDSPAVSPAPPTAVTFRFGSATELHGFTPEAHEYGEAERQFGFERLGRGDSLIVGESGGDVVFYAWLMYGQMDLDQNVCIPIGPEYAYSYKVFTVESARGLRICAAYYRHITDFLRQQGYRRLICRIAPGNTASIHAHTRVGFEPTGLLWKVAFAGRTFYWANREMRARLEPWISRAYFDHRGLLLKHDE